MRMRSVSEYKWSDTMEKQDIIGSIAENGGLCPKTKAYIRQLFRNKGIKEEPTYQRYTEEYIW